VRNLFSRLWGSEEGASLPEFALLLLLLSLIVVPSSHNVADTLNNVFDNAAAKLAGFHLHASPHVLHPHALHRHRHVGPPGDPDGPPATGEASDSGSGKDPHTLHRHFPHPHKRFHRHKIHRLNRG
jgi:Flp pilus assembly pilin Flp